MLNGTLIWLYKGRILWLLGIALSQQENFLQILVRLQCPVRHILNINVFCCSPNRVFYKLSVVFKRGRGFPSWFYKDISIELKNMELWGSLQVSQLHHVTRKKNKTIMTWYLPQKINLMKYWNHNEQISVKTKFRNHNYSSKL